MSFLSDEFVPYDCSNFQGDYWTRKSKRLKRELSLISEESCNQLKLEEKCLYCQKCIDDDEDEDVELCRFIKFRKLKKDYKGQLKPNGFQMTHECEKDDLEMWIPQKNDNNDLTKHDAKYLISHLFDSLKKIVDEEENLLSKFFDEMIAWKKFVKNSRELCDICKTTIFNVHFVCERCGFSVCIDCFNTDLKKVIVPFGGNENECTLCFGREDLQLKHTFILTQIIPGKFLKKLLQDAEPYNDSNYRYQSVYDENDTMEISKVKVDACTLKIAVFTPVKSEKTLTGRKKILPKPDLKKVKCENFLEGRLLVIDNNNIPDLTLFQSHWGRGKPVIVKDVHKVINPDLWNEQKFTEMFGSQKCELVNCLTSKRVRARYTQNSFWNGFSDLSARVENGALLKLKDWPPDEEFEKILPDQFADLLKALPICEYTQRKGKLNLVSHLPSTFVPPDLGPKLYCAYGSTMYPSNATTNLHLDVSDAVNILVKISVAQDKKTVSWLLHQDAVEAVKQAVDCEKQFKRISEDSSQVGAIWHIYKAKDTEKIRDFLKQVAKERNLVVKENEDPIHDQSWYLDNKLRQRLFEEKQVEGFAIVQCLGDVIFIPAGGKNSNLVSKTLNNTCVSVYTFVSLQHHIKLEICTVASR